VLRHTSPRNYRHHRFDHDGMSDIEKKYETPGAHAPGSLQSDEVERRLGEVDPVLEAKLVKKLDLFIIPVVMLLYLLSFLDRYV
jgi:hypothetical protein